MKRGRGRPMKKWSLNAVDHIAEYFDTEFKSDLIRVSITADSAERVAERMLNIAAKKDPKYNNYSGNLQRSYMVMARSGHMRNYYVVNPDLVPKPKVTSPRLTLRRYRDKRGRFYYKPFNTSKHTRYFRLTFKRHNHSLRELRQRIRGTGLSHGGNQRDRFVRTVRKNEERFAGAGYMHQYTHKDMRRTNKGFDVASRHADAHFVLTNLTPYAESVEKKGYRVLDYGKQNKYRKIVKEEVGRRMAVGVKWITEQMNRGAGGRFVSKIKTKRR